MSDNIKDLVHHLSSTFPVMFQLYTSMQNRSTLPTPFEVKIAQAASDITDDEVKEHLKTLKISASSGTIQGAFDRQTAVRQPLFRGYTLLIHYI